MFTLIRADFCIPAWKWEMSALRLHPVGEIGETDPSLKRLSHKTPPQPAVSLCVLFFYRLISWTVVLFSQLSLGKKKKKSTFSIRKISFSCLGRKGRGGGLRVKGELGGGQGEGREAIGIELRTADERGLSLTSPPPPPPPPCPARVRPPLSLLVIGASRVTRTVILSNAL